jgi:membrane-anchored glycerophosphoryl diester phosphodiesterase (GDPDase)
VRTSFPILKQNIFDDKWFQAITDSISHTIIEAEKVFYDAGLRHQIIIVFHLTNFIRQEELPISKEIKYKMIKKQKRHFLVLMIIASMAT